MVAAAACTLGAAATDPIAMLTLMGANSSERSKAAAGGAVLTIVPAHGRDLAVFGVVMTTASPRRLADWARAVEQLYRGRFVPAIGRFSDPPRLADLAALTLDEQDLNDVRDCRAGDCPVKLSAAEMARIQRAADAAGSSWRGAVQDAFREVVHARVVSYVASGLSAAPSYDDRRPSIVPQSEFEELAVRFGFEPLYGSHVIPYFRAFPDSSGPAVESFLYWSKEAFGDSKPIVSVTHVAISRTVDDGVLVAARQVFASHYLTGSLSMMAITGGGDGGPTYLVYLRRSRTDTFDGAFGRLVRHIVERRIRSGGPAALDALRRKLEQGDPGGVNPAH